MKISVSNMKFKTKQSRTLFRSVKSITISLPNVNLLNIQEIKNGLMPNFIHSLDSANIHILIEKLNNLKLDIPIYTVHDCFASTPKNMNLVNNLVKDAFADIYFKKNYLLKMHENLIDQIKSFNNDNIIIDNNLIYFNNKSKNIYFPELPETIE